MTTDVVINNIINDLCQRFNVASAELVPRLQVYNMAMAKFATITSMIFFIAFAVVAIVLIKKDVDAFILCILLPAFFGAISLVVMLFNIYEYIGWKYAPEIKTIEYIMWLFKN